MTTASKPSSWRSVPGRYAWVVGLLLLRTHYFLTVIVGPVFGWR